jgi:rhodanese-related sulfurtransferase
MDAQSYQISPVDLKKKQDNGESFVLLDVREPAEFQFAHIPNSILIPLGQLAAHLEELDPDDEIVTICHHGMRSMSALGLLVQRGFTNVKNLTGGIDAYSQLADPKIPRYR